MFYVLRTKRKKSDSVLIQKPLYQQKCKKGKVTTQNPTKNSIIQRLRTGFQIFMHVLYLQWTMQNLLDFFALQSITRRIGFWNTSIKQLRGFYHTCDFLDLTPEISQQLREKDLSQQAEHIYVSNWTGLCVRSSERPLSSHTIANSLWKITLHKSTKVVWWNFLCCVVFVFFLSANLPENACVVLHSE